MLNFDAFIEQSPMLLPQEIAGNFLYKDKRQYIYTNDYQSIFVEGKFEILYIVFEVDLRNLKYFGDNKCQ